MPRPISIFKLILMRVLPRSPKENGSRDGSPNLTAEDHNHSFTSVRLGGHAGFSIEYKDYRITGVSPFKNVSSVSGK